MATLNNILNSCNNDHIFVVTDEDGCQLSSEADEIQEESLYKAGSIRSLGSFGSDDGSSSSGFCSTPQRERLYYNTIEVGSSKKIINNEPLVNGLYRTCGKITFTTEYSQTDNVLIVHVIRAFDLILRKFAQSLKIYIQLYLRPNTKFKHNTSLKVGSRDPLFNEAFTFKHIDEEAINTKKLRFKVYNYSRVRSKRLIGEVEICLSSLDLVLKETFHVDLFMRRQQVSIFVLFKLCFYWKIIEPQELSFYAGYFDSYNQAIVSIF